MAGGLISNLHSIAVFAFLLASLIELGLNGNGDGAFIAMVSLWSVLIALKFAEGLWIKFSVNIFSDAQKDASATLGNAWSNVKLFIFLAGMIILGKNGMTDSSFVALFVVWMVLLTMQLLEPIITACLSKGNIEKIPNSLSMSFWEIVWVLFIASMVILGTRGKDDPAVIPLLITVAIIHIIAVVCMYLIAACTSRNSEIYQLVLGYAHTILALALLEMYFLLFISSMVLVGKYGVEDPTFVASISTWGGMSVVAFLVASIWYCVISQNKKPINFMALAQDEMEAPLLSNYVNKNPDILMKALVMPF
jgi:hypothetical protein